jgi:glycosyltransferase involved in cell wall biosynthesis
MSEKIIFDPHYDRTEVRFSLTVLQEKFIKYVAPRDDIDLNVVVPNEHSVHRHIYDYSPAMTGLQFWGTDKPRYLGVAHDKFSEASCDKVNLSWKNLQNEKDYYVWFTPRIRGVFDLLNMLQKGFVFKPTIVLWLIYDHQSQPWFELNAKLKEMCAFAMVNFRTVFTNEMIYEQWHSMIKLMFSPALVRKFEENSRIFNLGIDCDLVESVRDMKRNKVFTFVYGGRCTEIKGLDKMLDVVEKLNESGRECKLDLYLTLDSDTNTELLDRLENSPYVTITKNPKDQTTFLKASTKAHAYLVPCKLESYGMSWLEMMYAGALGIYWERDWQKSVLPPDYRWKVKNIADMAEMAMYVFDHYDELNEDRGNAALYVAENHNTKKTMNAIADYLILLSKNIRTKKIRDHV